jgi:hypothetical protein
MLITFARGIRHASTIMRAENDCESSFLLLGAGLGVVVDHTCKGGFYRTAVQFKGNYNQCGTKPIAMHLPAVL